MEKSFRRICPSGKICLLWLIDSLTMGGAERLVTVFANYLDKASFDLKVACLKIIDGNPIASELESIGVPVTVIGPRSLTDPLAFGRLVKFIVEQKIDVIHTHLTYADIWGGVAALVTGRPAVSTVHVPSYVNNIDVRRRDKIVELIARFVRRKITKKVIAVSDALRLRHTSNGFPPNRIITIHNGIDLSKFEFPNEHILSVERSKLGIPHGARVVINVAVLREGKGHFTLLSSAEKVLKKIPEARFIIVGGGPLEKELKQDVEKRGLNYGFIFTGMRRDVSSLLALADLFVFPSQFDSFPTVLLEAMAMRLPIVAFESGGVAEIVVNGRTGVLIKPSESERLADTIISMLLSSDHSRQMGELGREKVEAEFGAETWTAKLEDLYFRILRDQKQQ